MTLFETIIIAIVEGITEFLPISSTGHMILTQAFLGIESNEFIRTFIVSIQFGAILSVIVLYWKRFFKHLNFYYKLAVACIPLIAAYFLEGFIDSLMSNVWVVAISLLLGGLVLLFIDKWFSGEGNDEEISFKSAFIIGLFQIISIIPGVSRSAATIIGGMSQKLSRKSAAEFSFFLAVPTMFAASALKLVKNYEVFTAPDITNLVIGNVVAFVVAMLAIKFFIDFLTKHGFRLFGWYRIIIGTLIIILMLFGVDLSIG